jgi:hypothetical protein
MAEVIDLHGCRKLLRSKLSRPVNVVTVNPESPKFVKVIKTPLRK